MTGCVSADGAARKARRRTN